MRLWGRAPTLGFIAGALVCAGWPAHSLAALGGSYDSVEADRAHMAAHTTMTAGSNYRVHALTLANGGVAREYTRADGTVFAVAWQGPGRPDLQQLLGDYFTTYQAKATVHRRRARSPLTVANDSLLVQSSGHPGAFHGMAYLPQAAPAGFSPDTLGPDAP